MDHVDDSSTRDEAQLMVEEASLAATMAAIAESLHRQAETEDLLRLIVMSARDTVPGTEHVGVSIAYPRGRIETVAATDALVYQVDEVQYRLHEGPCIDALNGHWPRLTEDLRVDKRWPAYAPAAADLGIRSQLGLQLFHDPQSLGALNLYSTTSHAFSEDTVHIAGLFARHAAHALGRTLVETQLTEALSTRKLIGQVVGIVMERYRLTEQQAFTYLVRLSQATNVKLPTLAAVVVDQTNDLAAAQSVPPGPSPSAV